MPFFFTNCFGFVDFKGDVYLNETFFPLVNWASEKDHAETLLSALTLCHLQDHIRLMKTNNGCYKPLMDKPFILGIESGCYSRIKWLYSGKSLDDVTDEEAQVILESKNIATSLADLADHLNMIPTTNPTTSTEHDIQLI